MKRVKFKGLTFQVLEQITFRNKRYRLKGKGNYGEMLSLVKTLRANDHLVQFRFIKSTMHRRGMEKLPVVYARRKSK